MKLKLKMEENMLFRKMVRAAFAQLFFHFVIQIAISVSFLILILIPQKGFSQPPQSMPEIGAAQFSADSLKRVITKRILSDAGKKEIRSCEKEKTQSLNHCRNSDSTFAEVNRKINDAKLTNANPNDPAIQSLLEKKFALEKSCDDAFNSTAKGKQCLVGENQRKQALDRALAKDKGYQKLIERSQSMGTEHL